MPPGSGAHDGAMDPAVLDTALDRAPVNDDGRSGATLERVLLADGSRVVVKRFDPSVDLVMRLSGDTRGREVDFFRRGILDRLPRDGAAPGHRRLVRRRRTRRAGHA